MTFGDPEAIGAEEAAAACSSTAGGTDTMSNDTFCCSASRRPLLELTMKLIPPDRDRSAFKVNSGDRAALSKILLGLGIEIALRLDHAPRDFFEELVDGCGKRLTSIGLRRLSALPLFIVFRHRRLPCGFPSKRAPVSASAP
jgi:hypothetical protein